MAKTKKTIWYCHHYAGSPSLGMSFRPYYLTKEFCKLDYDAYIISASFHHLKKNTKQRAQIEKKEIDDVNFISVKTPQYWNNGILRFLNMLSYAFSFLFHSKKIVELSGVPDIIVVSSGHPFHYPFLKRIAARYQAKLIFEVRDLWPLSLLKLMNFKTINPIIFCLSIIERNAYRNSKYVVSLLDKALPYMESKGLQRDKYKVIPNGISLTDILNNKQPISDNLASEINAYKSKGCFLLGYIGSIGKPNALDYLISAMEILQSKDNRVHCFIIGDGNLREQYTNQIDALKLNNISMFPRISKSEVQSFLTHMDMLYIGWHDTDLYAYGVSPNKIFDYMISGKPILESCKREYSIVHQYQCGLNCEPANPEAIATAIIDMKQMPLDKLNRMGEKGIETVRTNFCYERLALEYVKLFQS